MTERIAFTIQGTPITKKNSQRIIRTGCGRVMIIPSAKFKEYEREAIFQIPTAHKGRNLTGRYNLRVVYYMPTRRRVDLVNLLEATCDILVSAGVIKDDHSGIIVAHDGCRVRYDKENPRAEITLEEVEEDG